MTHAYGWLRFVAALGFVLTLSLPLVAAHGEVEQSATASCANKFLAVGLDADGRLAIKDLVSATTYDTSASGVRVAGAKGVADGIHFQMVDQATELELRGKIRLDGAEMVVSLTSEGNMPANLSFPGAFATKAGDNLILPYNEGISYPVDDSTIKERDFLLFAGGNGLCMPWYGVTRGGGGWMAIVETADDALVDMVRRDGYLELRPGWISQKGQFGYERVIRFVFFDQGGYVAMAKRYRRFAQEKGLLKTLVEKQKQRPNVDKLVGAANVWFKQGDNDTALDLYRDMKSNGLDRVLWHGFKDGEQMARMKEAGALNGTYDIYQDAMNPVYFPRLDGVNGRWVTEAWENDDIILDKDGAHYTSWRVEARDGERIACGVVCDVKIPGYARARIAKDAKTLALEARLIDTTTAAPWRECSHPDHPMTRTESKDHRMELLRMVGEEFGMVCGAESGHAEAVPYVDYFEGMLSLATYRVPDAGHKPFDIWHEVPEVVSKFQTGHFYRLPLWELVFHDCAVSHWYWGDFNNKLPALWDRRDLINILYGTPPLLSVSTEMWEQDRDRFIQCFRTTLPVARATGYSEMLSHEWLTDDRTVQRTTFANGAKVTVNFGDQIHRDPDGLELAPLGYRVEGIKDGIETNDYPPNPLEKEGWVLTAHDEFDGPELNPDLWVADYLGDVAPAERSNPRYELRDGSLVLKIERDQPTFWGGGKLIKVSGIQTAQKPRLRPHFKQVRDIPTEMKFTQQYGYFEIRAKTYVAEGYHSAFWTIGAMEDKWQQAEIDIFEQYREPGLDMFNLHRWQDPHLEGVSKKHRLDFDPTEGFNIYALEWDEHSIKKYVNNELVATIDQSPNYPAVFILSIYENAGWNGVADTSGEPGYPKEFVIDYFRAYARADEAGRTD